MSTLNNYYPRGLPFIFILFYWIKLLVWDTLKPRARMGLGLSLVALSFFALWTNHHFTSYPNVFNFSRNPMIDPLVAETLPTGGSYFDHKVRDYPEELKLPVNSLGGKR